MKRIIIFILLLQSTLLNSQEVKKPSRENSTIKSPKQIKTFSPKVSFIDSIPNLVTFDYGQIMQLGKLHLISGIIYFSGANFPNVGIVRADSNSRRLLYGFSPRSGPGTKITFDNVICADSTGKRSILINKVFTLY